MKEAFSVSMPPSSVRTARTIGVVVALTLASSEMVGQAYAAEAAETDAATRFGLEIVIVGPRSVADLLSVAIAPLLAEVASVTWRQLRETTPVSSAGLEPRRGDVRIWIDTHRAGTVTVVGFSGRGAPRVRSVEAPDLTPVVAETIGQVVHETAIALMIEPAKSEADAASDPEEPDAARPNRRVVVEASPRAEPAAAHAITTPSSPSIPSLAFGGVVRRMGGFSDHFARGVSVSTTAWQEHETVRSFATLAFDWVENATGDPVLSAASVVPTVGISWRPQKFVDLRASIGVGADRIYSYEAPSWYSVARATASASEIVLARFEVTLALMIDAVVWDGFTHRGWQPAALLGIGWW